MSKLLFDDPPLVISPALAAIVGLNESIILQQMHYWLQSSKHKHDGYEWIYNSYPQWKEQFPFWSEATIKRTIRKLEKAGLITTGNYNKMNLDRTKWYRLDYDALASIGSKCTDGRDQPLPSGQNAPTIGSKCTDHRVKMHRPSGQNDPTLPETPTETTSESTAEEGGAEKPPTPPIDTQSPTALPASEAQMAMLFPSGGSSKIYDFERSIATAGWDIRRADIRRSAALFLRASGLPIPNDKTTQGDWIKALNQHVNDYGVKVLEELYPATIGYMREGDDPMVISRPGSVTKTLAAVCADLNNGGNDGTNSGSSKDSRQSPQGPGSGGMAPKVGAAIKAKSRGNSS